MSIPSDAKSVQDAELPVDAAAIDLTGMDIHSHGAAANTDTSAETGGCKQAPEAINAGGEVGVEVEVCKGGEPKALPPSASADGGYGSGADYEDDYEEDWEESEED
jgi:hypothetical protein